MSSLLTDSDGVLNCHLHDTGRTKITGVLTQPGKDVILKQNQELRKHPELQKDLTFGRLVAQIPKLDLLHWTKKYPILADYRNPKAKRKAWLKFLASSEGSIYLVRSKKRGKV